MSADAPILVVDDDPGTRKVARANLSLSGFEVLLASGGEDALRVLRELDPLAMVCDLKMPDMDGITLMDRAHEIRPRLPVVLVTAHATVETAVDALHRGALHYLEKPIRFEELARVLSHAVAAERSRRDLVTLRSDLERTAGFEDMVGTSPAIREVLRVVAEIADTPATVLVSGETGTGKELVARALHRLSQRRERPFIGVNCSAIPRELMESEFFGHEKGAFTGAAGRRLGLFEQAHGSTLFLDEIGELDTPIQAKLLRVLQERELTRVGGSEPVTVDVRIVAASNRDLAAEVAARRFREDLYYRLDVIPLTLPPLRERASDLPLLMEHFLSSFGRRYGREVPAAPPHVLEAAAVYPWPGNVRELRNLCERAVLMGWRSVEPILCARERESGGPVMAELELPFKEARLRLVARFERQYLERLLDRHQGRVGEVARAMGLAERNLYEKMKAYGLNRDDYR